MKEAIGLIAVLAFFALSAFTLRKSSANPLAEKGTEIATLAGGCFWCMEPPYKDLDGVLKVVPG